MSSGGVCWEDSKETRSAEACGSEQGRVAWVCQQLECRAALMAQCIERQDHVGELGGSRGGRTLQVQAKKPNEHRRQDSPTAMIVAARAGDERAMEDLIREYQGRVASFVIAQNGEDHCEDLCQTIFVKMVLALPRLKAPELFEPWLFKIARNVCMDHHRGRMRWLRIFDSYQPWHDTVAQPDSAVNLDRIEAVNHAFAQLTPAQRRLLKLSLEQPRSQKELAKLAGIGTAALKLRLFRARERLRRILLRGKILDEA
jgi:RNA polymerase sigma-70 factor, ECF subfamily